MRHLQKKHDEKWPSVFVVMSFKILSTIKKLEMSLKEEQKSRFSVISYNVYQAVSQRI